MAALNPLNLKDDRDSQNDRQRLNSVAAENQARREAVNQRSTRTAGQEDVVQGVDGQPIEERIGHPQTEMFKKYGEAMRQTVDELFDAVKERDNKHNEVLSAGGPTGGGPTKRPDLWKQYLELDDKVRQLRGFDLYGDKVFKDAADRNIQGDKYIETVMSDPYMVLRLAECGQFYEDTGGETRSGTVTAAALFSGPNWKKNGGIGIIGENLRGNAEFAKKLLDIIPQDQAGFFYSHITGEAKKDKDLFIAAVAKSRTNFQFGSDEWKKDPEVQKIALAGGLAPESLKVITDRVENRDWRSRNAR